MFDTDLISDIKKEIINIFVTPAIEMQLFLVAIAIIIAFLSSLLLQRMAIRKFPAGSKHGWIANNLFPELLSPFLLIMALVAVGWISLPFLQIKQHPTIIASCIKIALVWLMARALLLLAQRHFIAYFISIVMLVLTLLSVTNLLAQTQASLNEVAFEIGNLHLSLLGVVKGVFTFVVLFWGAGVLSKSGESWLRKVHISFNARELAIKFSRITLYFLAFVFTLTEMGVDLTALTVFGGALAVGLGFGLQKIASNFLSGIILLFENTIETGDLIEVGNEKGWVRQMAIRHTLIETADGREVLVPNEDLIIGKVTNWTYTNTRARVDITLTIIYDSDVENAQKILIAAAKSYKLCISDPTPAAHLKEFNERGISIMLIFWIPDVKEGIAGAKSTVMLEIVRAFRAAGIKFAVAS